MKRYFIECHVDGEMLATNGFTIEASSPAAALRKAAKELRENYGDTDRSLSEFIDDKFHLDSLTELNPGHPFQSPVTTAIELLVASDNPILYSAGKQLDRWAMGRCDVL